MPELAELWEDTQEAFRACVQHELAFALRCGILDRGEAYLIIILVIMVITTLSCS